MTVVEINQSLEMDTSKESDKSRRLDQISSKDKSMKESSKQRGSSESKSKEGGSKRSRKEKAKPLTKVIIRRLPPSMTEEIFLKEINPIPEHDEFYFMAADGSLGEYTSCRAYINFVNQEDIFIFRDKFDGYVFVDNKGAEYPAIVEFAPFQGLAKNKSRKKDVKSATIDEDPHFLAFLQSLNAEDTEAKVKSEYSFQIKDDKKITSTPLLEFIAGKKQEKKDERKKKKDEKRTKKKILVAKGIPAAIQEHEEDDIVKESNIDDDIVVRTIKSRGTRRRDQQRDRDHKPVIKSVEKPDEKEKPVRTEREKKRAERDAKRRAARDARREDNKQKDRQKKIGDEPASSQISQKQLIVKTEEPEKPVGEEKIKRYSESRRERRQRAEQQRADNEKKERAKKEDSIEEDQQNKDDTEVNMSIDKKEIDVAPIEPKLQTQKSTDDSKREYSSGETEKSREDRLATRIKNKDRPSIQIYQPKPRGRLSSLKKDESKSGDENMKESCDSNNEKSSKAEDEPPSRPVAKQEAGACKEKQQKGEKKISRYSERRNRAKEQRESRIGSRSVSESSQTAAEVRALDEVKSIESKTEVGQSDTVE